MSWKKKSTNGPAHNLVRKCGTPVAGDFFAIYQKLVKDYLIIYEVKPEILFVLALFDTRQDPGKLARLAT